MRRRAISALVAFPLAAVVGFISQPASATTDGACPDATGVTVVVDFHELGGGIVVGCAPSPGRDSFEALSEAGFAVRSVLRSPGFLCRIDNKPSNDPCVDPSPAGAYWSFWLAPRGGTWCGSNLGAGNRTPRSGTVEGWSFSLNRGSASVPPPGIVPPAPAPGTAPGSLSPTDCDRSIAVPASTPVATTAAPTKPTPGNPAPTSAAPTQPGNRADASKQSGGNRPGTRSSNGSGRSATPSEVTPTTPGAPTSAAVGGALPPTDVTSLDGGAPAISSTVPSGAAANLEPEVSVKGVSETRARSDQQAGSPVGAIVGLVAILGLAGGAMLAARRRQRLAR